MNNKYNPWEDFHTFIQDIGEIDNLLNFIDKNNIDNYKNDELICNFILPINTLNQYNNCNIVINLLEEMNNLSSIQYEKLNMLEKMYEKYKYSILLSQEGNNILVDKLNELREIFLLFEKNKIKIANLLHNSAMTDSSVIKIKHNKKMDLLKIIKICISDYSSLLDLILLSQSMHQETINLLKLKVNEIEDNTLKLVDEVNKLNKIKSDN